MPSPIPASTRPPARTWPIWLLGLLAGLASAAPSRPKAVLVEGFDDVAGLGSRGWASSNRSVPTGSTQWFQGSPVVFAAQAGPANSYVGANFQNTSGAGTISNWLLSPPVDFLPGNELRFWTRTVNNPAFRDRLEVRISSAGDSTDVGVSAFDTGDFDALVFSVNPSLLLTTACPPTPLTGYPNAWCEIVLGPQQGIPTSGRGRIAFRYYVTNAGPGGGNSEYIGIDSFRFDEGVPAADLALSQAFAAQPQPTLGNDLDIALNVRNRGPSAASSITLQDELPPQLRHVANTCGAPAAGQTVSWFLPQLAADGTASCVVRVRVVATGTGVASASVAAAAPVDPDASNNSSTLQITGTVAPALAVPALGPLPRALLLALLAAAAVLALRRRATRL